MSVNRPPFVPFQCPTHGTRHAKHFVIHDTEGHGTVESVSHYFTAQGLGYGINYITEQTGRMGSLGSFNAETWHVIDHNSECIGCENVGFASTSKHDWYDKYLHQLWAQAWIIAWVCGNLKIPFRQSARNRQWLYPSGVCRHLDVPDNDHTDPGSGYPFLFVLEHAQTWHNKGVPQYIQDILRKAK